MSGHLDKPNKKENARWSSEQKRSTKKRLDYCTQKKKTTKTQDPSLSRTLTWWSGKGRHFFKSPTTKKQGFLVVFLVVKNY